MELALVTGGAGFIGSNLVNELLHLGVRVRVLDDLSSGKLEAIPVGAEFVEGSVLDAPLVRQLMMGVDACFHLAAVASVEACSRRLIPSHAVNVTGWVTILDAARALEKQPALVYASSAAVYGDNQNLPLSETSLPRPLSAYAADKLACEHHAVAAWTNYGLSSVGLRFFNVYGPGQDPNSPYSGVISKFIHALASEEPAKIFGAGDQTRDFIYVADVVDKIIRSVKLTQSGARVFNVCTGLETSILDLSSRIFALRGLAPNISREPARLGEVKNSRGDPSAALQAFGQLPSTSLNDGLAALFATIKQD